MTFVVGLTGGIGSGKSAAADEFGRLGASIVDTDAIAHELTQAGGAAVPHIEKLFGKSFVSGAAMDRRKMREHVFSNPTEKKKLEALLHPMIREESKQRIAAARGPYVVHVVPLLVESRDYKARVDRVLVIDSPEDLQIRRVRERSGLPESETIDALRQQVFALHQKYLQFAGT
jgi:dephospho-CoA kinase